MATSMNASANSVYIKTSPTQVLAAQLQIPTVASGQFRRLHLKNLLSFAPNGLTGLLKFAVSSIALIGSFQENFTGQDMGYQPNCFWRTRCRCSSGKSGSKAGSKCIMLWRILFNRAKVRLLMGVSVYPTSRVVIYAVPFV